MSQIADYSPQGHVARDLAARFGTPLYVYDADTLRSTYTALREGLHPGVDVFYSAKANPNISVCGLLRSMGAGMEVSLMAELVTALRAGTAPDDIIFLGPGKSRADLQACLDHGIYAVVCESLNELACLDEMASGRGTRVLLRVNPSFSAKGSRLAMGGKPRGGTWPCGPSCGSRRSARRPRGSPAPASRAWEPCVRPCSNTEPTATNWCGTGRIRNGDSPRRGTGGHPTHRP